MTLATSSILDMTNFLTQVLDIGMAADESLPYIELNGLKINFFETELTDLSHSTFLTLRIQEEEFESIVDKFTFFMFRKGLEAKNFYEIHHDGVSLKDPDGRLWKIKTELTSQENLTL